MSSTSAPAASSSPDFDAVKARQQATWASGDFSFVAARIVYEAEHLCETADLQAGWKVLDVATGSGNAALAAARRGCQAVGVDYVPASLERGRLRAEAEHLSVLLLVLILLIRLRRAAPDRLARLPRDPAVKRCFQGVGLRRHQAGGPD